MNRNLNEELDKWAKRGMYSFLMGIGAFFSYFNSTYEWVKAPDYSRLSDFLLKPLLSRFDAYLPFVVIALGIGFLGSACYCYHRYNVLAK